MNNPNKYSVCPGSEKPFEPAVPPLHCKARSPAASGFILTVGAVLAATHLVAATQIVTGTVPPITASLQPLGTLDPGQQLNLAIAMPLQN
jgi:hypothetical protein